MPMRDRARRLGRGEGAGPTVTVQSVVAGCVAGVVGGAALVTLGRGPPLFWLLTGGVAGLLASVVLGRRALGPGKGLLWSLTAGFAVWVLVVVVGAGPTTPIRSFLPTLVAVLVGLATPIGLCLGLVQELQTGGSITPRNWPGALVTGGLAGLAGGLAVGGWVVSRDRLAVDRVVFGEMSVAGGWLLTLVVAVAIGASFGVLFGRDLHDTGLSLCCGLAYGVFWWLVGWLTLLPLVRGVPVSWTVLPDNGAVGAFVAHAVFGIVLGLVYGLLDRCWLALFGRHESPFRVSTGPGGRVVGAVRLGTLAGIVGALPLGVVLVATGDLSLVGTLLGRSSAVVGAVAHVGIAALLGIGYVLLFGERSPDVGSAVCWGLVYGLGWWLVGWLTLLWSLLGAPPLWTHRGVTGAVPALVGHLGYGVGVGLLVAFLTRTDRAWAAFDPRADERARRRRPTATLAPAIWLFTLGVTTLVVLAVP